LSYAEGVSSLRDIVKNSPKPNVYTHLQSVDPENTCSIAHAADLCLLLTKGLDESKGVYQFIGNVESASWSNVCVLLYFVLFCFVLFVLCCVVLFCFVLFCLVLFCLVLSCLVLSCFVLFCYVLFCYFFPFFSHDSTNPFCSREGTGK
jgi:hypothetical protein